MQGKVTLFSTGKMISVGTKSPERAEKELVLVGSPLEKKGIAKLNSRTTIRNIVATADLGFNLDLESLKPDEGTHIIYEPEQFPAAIISFILPEKARATVLLFSSGKIVCVGLKDRKSIENAIQHLLRIIS